MFVVGSKTAAIIKHFFSVTCTWQLARNLIVCSPTSFPISTLRVRRPYLAQGRRVALSSGK